MGNSDTRKRQNTSPAEAGSSRAHSPSPQKHLPTFPRQIGGPSRTVGDMESRAPTSRSIKWQITLARLAAVVGTLSTQISHHHRLGPEFESGSLCGRTSPLIPWRARIMAFTCRAGLTAKLVRLVVDLSEVLGDFDLDLVCDHDLINVTTQVGPENWQRRHDCRDVDFENRQDDRFRSVKGWVECWICCGLMPDQRSKSNNRTNNRSIYGRRSVTWKSQNYLCFCSLLERMRSRLEHTLFQGHIDREWQSETVAVDLPSPTLSGRTVGMRIWRRQLPYWRRHGP